MKTAVHHSNFWEQIPCRICYRYLLETMHVLKNQQKYNSVMVISFYTNHNSNVWL